MRLGQKWEFGIPIEQSVDPGSRLRFGGSIV